ncbi:MAG: alpha-ketoglutarate-dependent dioxygenase AlkB [Alphaproteobacteria bacterium]|nr:alpha-ketoglutarate-dependent dioxygenase AlkB [Alphaproteobacteria bacterium]MCB9699814.1 alpha-ketoglutarate-dependent dioxygenase AlkB [Alphaproteobacteria bacterium]
MERVDLGRGAWIAYEPAWLTQEEADALQSELTASLPWEQRPIVVAGREVMQPRLMAWAGALPYRYSGQTLDPAPATPTLDALTARVSEACGTTFNHVVVNRYRDGKDNIGRHADAEPELGWLPTIASLSLGARRKFVLARKGRRKSRHLRLAHGSLLVMGGSLQHTWYHSVPKDGSTEERLNLTFRTLIGPPGTRQPGGWVDAMRARAAR